MADQSSTDDGGSAFPQHGWTSDRQVLERMKLAGMGMSLRDYFAARAMQSIVNGGHKWDVELVAQNAYEIADAMIARRGQS